MTDLLVPKRYCGPPSSGNGGWTAGAVAALTGVPAGTPVTVSLRRPPPLETPMSVATVDGVTTVRDGEHVVALAEASPDTEPVRVEPVDPAVARAAEASYAGLGSHPFPTCFVCGTGRQPGDGLRIFPGRVDDQAGAARLAATWTPHPSLLDGGAELPEPAVWAALDCAGAWAGDLEDRPLVLARMTARVDALPRVGVEHVVVGLARGTEGRKTWTATAIHDAHGTLLASAEHLWVAIDPADFA